MQTLKRIVVFGATGGTGKLVEDEKYVRQAPAISN
jgi:hypothetical protein